MILIDTHCHLDFPEYDNKEAEVIERAKREGVSYFLNIGSTRERSEKSVALAKRYAEVYASVGIHPHDAAAVSEIDLAAVVALANEKKVVAYGEVGLDYFRNLSPKEEQIRVFRYFLKASMSKPLPFVFHIRDAFDDFFDIVSEHRGQIQGGVAHCFTGKPKDASKLLELGFYISFTGILTYKKNDALRHIAREVPLDRILLETDAPFLAPEGLRGKVNEPSFMTITAKTLAEIKQVSLERIAEITTQNCKKLFGFPG